MDKMSIPLNKDKVRDLLDKLPDNSTWDDLIREIYMRQVIEQGLADSNAGRTRDVFEIRKKYGISK